MSWDDVFDDEPTPFDREAHRERVLKALEMSSQSKRAKQAARRIDGDAAFRKLMRDGDPEVTGNAKPTRRKPSDYTKQTKRWLEERGYRAERVDHYNAFAGVHNDLFGIFDFLAIGNGETVGVQVTSRSNMGARRNKINASDWRDDLKRSGWKFLLLGFDKEKGRYRVKVEWL